MLTTTVLLLLLGFQQKSDVDDSKKAQFLELIKQIESSGGKNTRHHPVESGPYAGQTAVGQYGMLPTTVQEVLNRSRETESNPVLEHLRQGPVENLGPMMKMNPPLEEEVAGRLADYVLQKNNDDMVRAAYGWNMGHNKNYTDLPDEEVLKNVNARKMDEMLKNKFKALETPTKGELYGRRD